MDFFVWLLFTVLGGAVGAGVTSMVIKERLAKEEEQREIERQTGQLAVAEQLEDMRKKMGDVREEGKQYWEKLQEKIQQCRALEEQAKKVAGLEENIAALRTKNETLAQEKNEYLLKVRELEEDLAREKEVINECLIFVQGSHYLPGSVVLNLMRQEKMHKKQEVLG
jgi:predicted RNase H-like nuclease (RuvC/YqgF family)